MGMRKSGFARQWALATAVTIGATSAFVHTVADRGQIPFLQGHAPGNSSAVVAGQGPHNRSDEPGFQPSPSPAPPPAPFGFNAKLSSRDIPVLGGGVRTGGCSGALIDPSWVITAGHCFHDVYDQPRSGRPLYHMTVVVGKAKDSDPGGYTRQVVDVRQSPLNDLAVVRLDTPIKDVTPVTLDEHEVTVGQQLEFSGWGSHSATVIQQSDHLKLGHFAVSAVTPTTLEAQPLVPRTVENSPCPDDSGSPYFPPSDTVHGPLMGIENSGPDCPQPGTEILARVDIVANWIHQQVAGN